MANKLFTDAIFISFTLRHSSIYQNVKIINVFTRLATCAFGVSRRLEIATQILLGTSLLFIIYLVITMALLPFTPEYSNACQLILDVRISNRSLVQTRWTLQQSYNLKIKTNTI